jgi:FixJ family two-component response regulator
MTSDQYNNPERKFNVYVVDDDAGVRDAIGALCRSAGFNVASFARAQEFLAYTPKNDAASCLIVDVRLPGMSGLELQQALHESGVSTPVIFMTGYGDIPMTVAAMKHGAVEFLTKPFREQELLDAVNSALLRDQGAREQKKRFDGVNRSLSTLTAREHEVLGHVVSGRMNKQIAFDLGLSQITVKVHRGNMMRKMNARSLVDLVRMVDAVRPVATETSKKPSTEDDGNAAWKRQA